MDLTAGVLLLAIRRRQAAWLLALAPFWLQSMELGLVMSRIEFRYQYPVYLAGWLIGMPLVAWPVWEALPWRARVTASTRHVVTPPSAPRPVRAESA